MNKIVVKQSRIEINNYELGDSPKLEYFFSIYDPMKYVYFYKGIEYIAEEKKLIVPRGIDIFWLEKLLDANAVLDTSNDKFDFLEDPILLKYLPRDDTQKEALRFLIGKGEYSSNSKKSQLSVNLNTGVGKTYVSIAKASCENVRTIMITSSTNWIHQWSDKIQEYTNIDKKEIYLIVGSQSISNLTSGRKNIKDYKFILASHDTIKSYASNNGWQAVTELFKLLSVGIKIFDEAHLYFDNISKIDYYTNTYQTIYLTATPSRSNENEDTIYQLYFKNVSCIDLFDKDVDPHTKYLAFRFNSNPTPQEISDCKNQYGLDRNKYTNYIVTKENFFYMIHILLNMVKKGNDKILMYVGTNRSISVIYEWMCENYPEYKDVIGIYTSVIPADQKEEQLKKRFILSTTKSCGAAMDIPHLKLTIVLAEPFKSKVIARQTLGRTRDDDTIYIEFVDDGFFYIKKYYLYKKDIFSTYAKDCTEVGIKNDELLSKALKIIARREEYCVPVTKYTKDATTPGRINNLNCYIDNTDYSELQYTSPVTKYNKEDAVPMYIQQLRETYNL